MTDKTNKPGDQHNDGADSKPDKASEKLSKDSPEVNAKNVRAANAANPNQFQTFSHDGESRCSIEGIGKTEPKQARETQEKAYRESGFGDPDVPIGKSSQKTETAVLEKQAEAQQQEKKPVPVIAQGVETSPSQTRNDGGGGLSEHVKTPGPDEVVAQIRPDKTAVHEAVETAKGVGLGVGHFTEATVSGMVDTIRMAGAAERHIDLMRSFQPDLDPEGTKKLHETCQGMAMGSRVLVQYMTTLNEGSPFYRKDFDPEARQAAEKLAQAMPEKLKEEINQYRNADTQTRAAKATELALDIFTCAEAGGLAVAKAGQIAKESKILSQISTDMTTFASKLKELPHSESINKMSEYLDKSLPKFGPKLVAEGPNNEAEEQTLKMVRHSDRGKPHDRGGDKVRESKKLDEMREAHQIEKLMKDEGWTYKHEAKTVKYLRDKGETITKNPHEGKVEGTMAKQTDCFEWELKSMSKVDERGKILRGVIDHAKDGSEKFTGLDGTQIGRVLIDTREQQGMTEALAEKSMREAFVRSPDLKEIRIIGKDQNTGKDFDIGLKRGQKEVSRR